MGKRGNAKICSGIRNTTRSQVEQGKKSLLSPGCPAQLLHFLLSPDGLPPLTPVIGGSLSMLWDCWV